MLQFKHNPCRILLLMVRESYGSHINMIHRKRLGGNVMKKLFAFLLILSLMLCAVGCHTSDNSEHAIKKLILSSKFLNI